MPADRPHDVSSLTAAQLYRARRDLQISLALAGPGSPVRVPVLAEMTAIDTALARTRRHPMTARDLLPDDAAPGNRNPGEGRADGCDGPPTVISTGLSSGNLPSLSSSCMTLLHFRNQVDNLRGYPSGLLIGPVRFER